MSNNSNNQNKNARGSQAASSTNVALTTDKNNSKLIDLIVNQDAKKKPADPTKVRRDLVDKVKNQIKAGTYETDDKLDQALDRLLDRLLD